MHVHVECYVSSLQALSPVGAIFGSIVAWPISDILGRQAALMMSGVPALAGWLMIALAHLASSHVHAFYGVLLAGRVLTGFSSGWSVFCVSVSCYDLTHMHGRLANPISWGGGGGGDCPSTY